MNDEQWDEWLNKINQVTCAMNNAKWEGTKDGLRVGYLCGAIFGAIQAALFSAGWIVVGIWVGLFLVNGFIWWVERDDGENAKRKRGE